MSTRTQRINLLVTPEEKAAIEAAALAGDMSVSEHIRQAALEYDVRPDELAEVKYLVKEVGEATERIHKRLRKHRSDMTRFKAEFKALRASHGLD
ncbi:ribbon-helix-helix protein, CopG family [Hellea sp.]|nr:ribbon-helix-helix protein, CopG family [Hellea sp.]